MPGQLLVMIGDGPPGGHVTGGLPVVHWTVTGVVSRINSAYNATTQVVAVNFRRVVQTSDAQTSNDRISFVLARADGDLGAASASLVHRLGGGWQVTDLGTTTARLANSITSVDLSGLVALDVGFAVAIAAVGVTLYLLAGLVERRRELATLVAIGAEPHQVRASIVGETLFIGVAGIAMGLLTGGLVGVALLQILAGVFDPPADLPAIPLVLIGAMTLAIVLALGAALTIADRGLSRLSVVAALRER